VGMNAGGVISHVEGWLEPMEDAANFIAAFFIFMLMILGITQIVLRTVFNAPLSGYIDLVELSMAGMAFLGAAYTQRMELLLGMLKGRKLWLAEVVGTLLLMFVVGVLIYYSWDHFLRSYLLGDTTIDAEYPVWPSKLLVPIALSFWFLRLAIQLAGGIRMLMSPNAQPVGVLLIRDAALHAKEEAEEVMGEGSTGNKGR
jgi:TRAP-type mannitol/chloroaromatic compound transport system permease small subunit